jgi:hypothetical protein
LLSEAFCEDSKIKHLFWLKNQLVIAIEGLFWYKTRLFAAGLFWLLKSECLNKAPGTDFPVKFA